MSTRAIYTFSDEDTAPIHVFKHHDGYPYASYGCRLITAEHPWEYASDAEYWYKIKLAVPALDVWVDVLEVDWSRKLHHNLIMEGALSELISSERKRHSRLREAS